MQSQTPWYEKRRFGDLADNLASQHPDREILVFGDARYTCGGVAAEIDAAAKAFIAQGIKHGDHVALWLNNCADWIFMSFALNKIGAVLVPINTRFRSHDLDYVLRQSDCSVLITHDRAGPIDYLEIAREVLKLPAAGDTLDDAGFPMMRQVFIVSDDAYDGTVSWNDAKRAGNEISDAALAERAASVDPGDAVFIMYTSGTTGRPKGVVHSHKLIRNIEERGFRMGITTNDVILNYLPLFHAFGYSEGMMMSLITGAKQIVTETFDPEECLDLVARERVTFMNGFEAHLHGLTLAQERSPRDISGLRTGVFAAGMHSATPVCRRAAKVLAPLKALSGYGLTEVWIGVGLCALDDDEEHRCETSGFPGLGYQVRIVDPETSEDVPPGVPGELITRGYSLMLGYYKKPEDTAACYDNDGWFYTGDQGLWLDDGYFRLLGRYKDMLKVGGENVDPMETEGMLLEHSDVLQIAIVGLADERLSEVPVAFVQRAPGSSLSAEDVVDYCRGKIASFKIPRHVVFVDEFPMTASGKIRKVDLRETAKRTLTDKD